MDLRIPSYKYLSEISFIEIFGQGKLYFRERGFQ